jgi:hypothetical protein
MKEHVQVWKQYSRSKIVQSTHQDLDFLEYEQPSGPAGGSK